MPKKLLTRIRENLKLNKYESVRAMNVPHL